MIPTELDFVPEDSLNKALAFFEPSLIETHPGAPLQDVPPLLFPMTHQAIATSHSTGAEYCPPLGIASLNNVIVYGGMFVGAGDKVFTSDKLYPGYLNHWIRTNVQDALRFRFDLRQRRVIPGTLVIVSNAHYVYGHWLLECATKLLYLKRVQNQLPPIRILLNGTPPFAEAWVRHILPKAEIINFNPKTEYVRCDHLLIPTLLSTVGYHFHPLLSDLVDEIVGTQGAATEQIYLTRERPSGFRLMENADEIEAIARDVGLRVVSPETLAITEQIALFARCKLVAGDFGSALHNTIFSQPGTAVIALNWIDGLQSRIARLRRQRVGYILPTSGQPVLYVPGRRRQQPYRIAPDSFKEQLLAVAKRLP